VEYKIGSVNVRREVDTRMAFWLGFGVRWISDDWFQNSIGVIKICVETLCSAREYFGSTWEDSPTDAAIPNNL